MNDEELVHVSGGPVSLEGNLALPPGAHSLVLFAHGSGSSRHSPRNKYVAQVLQESGLGTLLIDLLTPGEEAVDERTRHLRFDIPLLAERLIHTIDWLATSPGTAAFSVGLFGASTGAAAALIAAAERPERVFAVVSRGGRLDLAGDALPRVRAPTLLIVGARDPVVTDLNGQARARLGGRSELVIVRGATHLFEEPGALDQVTALARAWFLRLLPERAEDRV